MKNANRKIRPLRQSERIPVADPAHQRPHWHGVVTAGQTRVDCEVVDLSPGGAKLRMLGEFPFFSPRLWLMTDFLGPIPARLAWEHDGLVGLRFIPDAPILRRLPKLLAELDGGEGENLGGGDRHEDPATDWRLDLGVVQRL